MDQKKLTYQTYVIREEEIYHAPYAQELDFYSLVKSGNIEEIQKLKGADFTMQPGLGRLSDNSLRSAQYHFVIAAAMIARYCMQAGMEHEFAYNLSDMYINEVDHCSTTKEIASLQFDMILYFTTQMNKLRTSKVYSLPITKCIDYIYDNLHTSLNMSDLSAAAGISEGYLSRLFKKETGYTLTVYIQKRKLETAKNMILHSEYSLTMISEILNFTSQSYFIKLFKKQYGVTPAVFRRFNSHKLET